MGIEGHLPPEPIPMLVQYVREKGTITLVDALRKNQNCPEHIAAVPDPHRNPPYYASGGRLSVGL